jgi:hypothetical protein
MLLIIYARQSSAGHFIKDRTKRKGRPLGRPFQIRWSTDSRGRF